MITLAHLAKKFDTSFVIDDINLTIKQGEIVGLLGPNGAGKTTTLRMVAGVLPPTEGTVEINGIDIRLDYNKAKQSIGFLPENNPLYDDLTVEEFLDFWADIKSIPVSQKADAIDFVVESCGLRDAFYRPIAELSKGYRQRVGLAQAIFAKPAILLLDEPTEGLDPNQRQDIQNLIKYLGKERTVIISSHVLSEISKICNRLIIIHRGTIVADDTPDNLRKSKGKTQITEVEIDGTGVEKTLERLSGVLRVEQKRKNYFIIESVGRDLREDIFRTVVKKKWSLLTLMKKERELEDVFSQLTAD